MNVRSRGLLILLDKNCTVDCSFFIGCGRKYPQAIFRVLRRGRVRKTSSCQEANRAAVSELLYK